MMKPASSRLLRIAWLLLATTSASLARELATYARFVPESMDDFAWEKDLVSFRTYGPALRQGKEDSGIDCWLMRVPSPLINAL